MSNLSIKRVTIQIGALPIRLKLWLAWLVIITFIIPIFYLSNDFFRTQFILQICNALFGGYLMLRFGLVKLLSLSHLIFWTPMLVIFALYYESLTTNSLLILGWICAITVLVSLLLDVRDYFGWLSGDTSPMV